MVRDFKDNLILLFFKESEGRYINYDLLRLLSISQDFLENRIDQLIKKKLLFVDERLSYQITANGLASLSDSKFDRVNLFELMNKISNELKSNDQISNENLLDVFIPKNFENVLYSKKELDGLL
jgi:predicted transcriptional regulator